MMAMSHVERLSETDKSALALLFGGLESRLFLHSNFGAQLEKLAQLPPRERKKRCAPSMDGPPVVKVAHGVPDPVMDVKPSHITRVSDEPLALERWAWPANQCGDSDAARIHEARDACVWLVEHGRAWAVTVMFKLYAGVLPATESNELRFLGELAPLALDVPTVLNRAVQLTKRLRAGLYHPAERMETVTPRDALNDLLAGHGRKDYESTIRDEATELSGQAEAEYLKAKRRE